MLTFIFNMLYLFYTESLRTQNKKGDYVKNWWKKKSKLEREYEIGMWFTFAVPVGIMVSLIVITVMYYPR